MRERRYFVGKLRRAHYRAASRRAVALIAAMPRTLGETPLHAACRAGSLVAVNSLIESCSSEGLSELVNAKSVEGITPLMLAAAAGGGHGSESATEAAEIVRRLLSCGACAHAHGRSRRSAADYADEHGKPRLAAELRKAAAEQLAAEQTNLATETCTRCKICGDRLSGCKFVAARTAAREMSSAFEGAVKPSARSALIERFFDELDPQALATLSKPELHHVNNRRNFTRELTEAIAMLQKLRSIIGADSASTWHVIDLCCGKAFFATLVGVLYPSILVHAVDKQPPTFLPHFEEAGLGGIVEYVQCDVLQFESFAGRLNELIASNGGRKVIVMGMHLCGRLSLRAIDLLQSSFQHKLTALVLAPCCLPNVRIAEDTPPNVFESKEQSIQYERWCAFLKQRMEQAAASAQCLECESDQEKGLVSEKNVLLTAVRRRVAGEDGIEVE